MTSGSVRLWLGLGETCLCGPHRGFPLVGLRENGFVAGQAARKAESKKVDKQAKACVENQHVFVPFVFDTFGSLAPEVIHFLTMVQRVIHNNCSASGGQGFVFENVRVYNLERGDGAACCPSIFCFDVTWQVL
ncbi:hypothetical protein HanRHA438_Chr16g0766111 [Helianthus annuus]|nr:hypothetical protein HanRHA438_Chr16g0766111 [Helianthus annuus]